MITVVTSFSPSGWEKYAKHFVLQFPYFWPKQCRLLCYWEGEKPHPDCEGFDLLELEPCRGFLDRHRTDLTVQGLVESPISLWGPKARSKNYSFRHDAYKFARKVFAVAHASSHSEGMMFWVDADVVYRATIPDEVLTWLLPNACHLSYLKRNNYHSELGFVGYNLVHQYAREFINAYVMRYVTDDFMADKAWDDCNQFDYLVEKMKPITYPIPHNSQGQPFDYSMLGGYMTHMKGLRKDGLGMKWTP